MMQCLFVCLFDATDELILGFCYSDLTLGTGGFELASTINLVLQANRLTKCASENNWFVFQETLVYKRGVRRSAHPRYK